MTKNSIVQTLSSGDAIRYTVEQDCLSGPVVAMPRDADAAVIDAQSGTAISTVWRERILLALWAFAAIGYFVWCWNTNHFGPAHLAGGAALILTLALLARGGLVRILGPVLVYDVLRSARRGRFILVRWLYAIGLLLLLLWVYAIWRTESFYYRQQAQNEFRQLARLAEQYFIAFSITQFCAVALLTPAYVAGAIAEEKEKKTLEFLLATDLENREIIFGKLVSRLGNLALFILTGLPVLSLIQFFGGIDPGLLLASFAATAITAVSLAGLSILNSVLRRRARDAIILTYLAAIGYLAATGATQLLKVTIAFYYGGLSWGGIDWGNVFDWFHAGNPIFGIYSIGMTIERGGPLDAVIGEELKRYAIFHGIVAIASITWAVLRLRAVALGSAAVVAAKPRRFARKIRQRRPIGLHPMTWKELWIEGRLRIGVFGRVLVGLLVGLGFVPVIIIALVFAFERTNLSSSAGWQEWIGVGFQQLWTRWDEVGQAMNIWLRVLNVVISSLMLLGVAVRAAGSIGAERDRDTLVSLMTTPLTTSEIMRAKWLGALWSVRGFLWWLGSVWLIALVFGGVNPLAIVLHVIAWCAPAMCFASIGLLFSASCRTTLRATTWTIVAAILAGGGHWLCMGMCCYTPIGLMARGSGNDIEWLLHFEWAMSPPIVFAWDAFREGNDLNWFGRDTFLLVYVVIATVIWSVLAMGLWSSALAQFEKLTHRGVMVRSPAIPGAPASRPTD